MLRNLVAHISLTRAPHPKFSSPLPKGSFFFFLLESLRDCSVGLLLSLPGRVGTGAGKTQLPLISTNKASQPVAEFSVTHHTRQLAWGSPPARAHSIHQGMTVFVFLALYLIKTNKRTNFKNVLYLQQPSVAPLSNIWGHFSNRQQMQE